MSHQIDVSPGSPADSSRDSSSAVAPASMASRTTGDARLDQVLADFRRTDVELEERIVGSRMIHAGGYMGLRVDTVERPDGRRHDLDICVHPGAVAVLAIDDTDRVLLVRQFRVAANRVMLEIPAGTLDREADGSTEDPDGAARRELEEETGYRAASWRRIASFWTAPGFATELMHLYLATDLTLVDSGRLAPDENEALELVRLPVADAIRAAEANAFEDAKTLLGFLWLARLREPAAS